jgi:hypothetical protein
LPIPAPQVTRLEETWERQAWSDRAELRCLNEVLPEEG